MLELAVGRGAHGNFLCGYVKVKLDLYSEVAQ
jgi:hypothetical protein